jgi:hypothetical protein
MPNRDVVVFVRSSTIEDDGRVWNRVIPRVADWGTGGPSKLYSDNTEYVGS